MFLLSRLKDGHQISQTDRTKIVKEKETHSLTIEKARLEDTGSYSVSMIFVTMKVAQFWDVVLYSLVDIVWCFRGAYCFHH